LQGDATMSNDGITASDCQWQVLEEHFRYDARVANHFRSADESAVVAMCKTGTNAAGEPLSPFERAALCALRTVWMLAGVGRLH
jgi:hypothetical protein